MAIIDKIDKLSGTDTRSRNITQAIDKYSGKGPSKNIDDAVKKLDETGTLGKMGIKERIDHLSNAQTMSRNITQAIDRHTGKGPSKNIEEALKWWEDPTPPVPPEPPVGTAAYAVFDSADGSLVFFRDELGKYRDEQVIDTKTYYSGWERSTSNVGKWASGDRAEFITTVRFDDVVKPINTRAWFDNCENLTSIIGLDKLDTSDVTDMRQMFYYCKGLTSLDLSNFNTSNVTTMYGMFAYSNALASLDLSSFNTSKVTNMREMFAYCNGLTSINLSSFDTANVNTMSEMFSGCNALTSLDVSGFNTSNVTTMSEMFSGCNALTSLDVSGFNTSNVTTMSEMFRGCNALTSLDVSGFNTSNVANINGMFNGCNALTSLDVSGFNTSNVGNMSDMFNGCNALTSLDVSGFNTSKAYNMMHMFANCRSLALLDVSGFDTSNVTSMDSMFESCESLTTDITINNMSPYGQYTFYNAATNPPAKITLYGEGSVTSADIDTFIDSVKAYSSNSNIVNGMITEAYAVFDSVDNSLVFFRDEPGKYSDRQEEGTKTYYTGVETKTSTYGWSTKSSLTTNVRFDDVIKPISTKAWFLGHSNLASITGLDKLDTSDVTNMGAMFENCGALTSLDLSSFDTSNVTYMAQMFTGCSSLATLNLSGFNTSNVTDMHSMFNSCGALTSIGTTALYTAANTTVDWMFSGCSNLTAGVIVSSFSNYEYANAFAYSATVSPAQITLYYNSPATSGNLNAIIADAKASKPNSNIVNGGPAQ